MHKVEIAGHAGAESCLPSRLPVLKLLTGRAAIDGAQELRLGGGPQSHRRRAGQEAAPALRQSVKCSGAL